MTLALQFEGVGKQYRLGEIGARTIRRDAQRLWAGLRGRRDPQIQLGDVNAREQAGGEYVWALKDISFDVQQGEVFGIIGRNGAGKSTLLKVLSQITAPTLGRIRSNGRIASLLEVGTGFHPELTGRENIFLNGAILGMSKREIARRLDQIVDFSGCARYIDTPAKRYSSGMMVRLGFAVAAHLECEILVVDEVLAVGDAAYQKKCIGRMSEVAEGGRTVLFVSHNMQTIEHLCSRAGVIEKGQLAMVGSVTDAITSYFAQFGDEQLDQTARAGNGAVRITAVRLEDNDGKEVAAFEKGQTARAIFRANVTTDVPRLDLLVRIHSGVSREEATSIRQTVFDRPLAAGSEIDFAVDFDTSLFRTGIYPFLFQLSDELQPASERGKPTIYDVLDNATRPLSIVDDSAERIKGMMDIPSQLHIPAANHR